MFENLVFLGAIVQICGSLSYIRDTFAGRTKPNRITFLLWAAAPFIGSAIALSNGAGLAALPTFIIGFGPALVFLASFHNKNSFWRLQPFDYVCGALSIVAMILWQLVHQPILAMSFVIIADFFAGLPTFRKAWHHPETEKPFFYFSAIFNALTAFLAAKTFGFTTIGFPAYILFADGWVIFCIYRKKHKKVA